MSTRATFFGLEIGRTGLAVSQVGLDVTGHNIANVDTLGYTRQRIITTAYDPNPIGAKIKPLQAALVGGGSLVRVHDQIRSAFLDRQFRTEQALYSYWQTRSQGLTFVQSKFEDGEANFSLNDAMRGLFDAFLLATTNTDDVDPRETVRQNAKMMMMQFEKLYDDLVAQQQAQDLVYTTMIDEINTMAENIKSLNDAIYRFELLSNEYANDLRDKRNLLLDQLSEIADISYSTSGDGKLTVKIAGHDLVNHLTVSKLAVRTDTNPIMNENDIHVAYWVDGSDPGGTPPTYNDLDFSKLKAGSLKAAKELRDEGTSLNPGIPYYVEQLNNLVRALVQEINKQHRLGYTYPDPVTGLLSRQGVDFFDETLGIENITAKNLSLSQEIMDSINNIAASGDGPINLTPTGPSTPDPEEMIEGNNENMRSIYNLINSKNIVLTMTVGGVPKSVTIGSFEGFLTSIGEDVFNAVRLSNNILDTQQVQIIDIDNQRQAISGVSLDEEMTNLMKYTHAYNGAARVITAMDEAIDVIVNRMGRVGL